MELVELKDLGSSKFSFTLDRRSSDLFFKSQKPYIYIYIYIYIYNTIMEVALHTKYIDIELVYLTLCAIQENLGRDLILKWEMVKICRKYKAGNKYCYLCIEEEIVIAS